MNFKLVSFLVLLLAGGNLFASKARLESLSQNSSTGSNYILDSRSVFKNPGLMNEYTNFIITEWGSDAMNNADSNTNPKAEGGLFKKWGYFNYGVYLGNEDARANALRKLAEGTSTSGLLEQDNRVDLFFGGDAGFEWGVDIYFSNNQDEINDGNTLAVTLDRTQNTAGGRFGIVQNQFAAYANIGIRDESNGSIYTDKAANYDGKLNLTVGGNYFLSSSLNIFAEVNRRGFDYKANGAKKEYKEQTILVGVGHIMELSNKAKVFMDANLKVYQNELTSSASTALDQWMIPLTFGLEAPALSWLSLRGSVSQYVFSSTTNDYGKGVVKKKKNMNNTTAVNAGASLIFGAVAIDGVVGLTDTTLSHTTPTSSSAGTKNGVLNLDDLLTRVSLSYYF